MIPIYNKGKFVVKGAVRIDRPHLERVREPNVADVDKDQPVTDDLSCWVATAANMLALKGYGDGTGLQVRANGIYNTLMDDVYDDNGGFIYDGLVEALDIYGTSSGDVVLMLGNRTRIPYEKEGLDELIKETLNGTNAVGISISFYTGSTIYGGHAVTAAEVDTENKTLWIADSDIDPLQDSTLDNGGFTDAFDNRKRAYTYNIGDVNIAGVDYTNVMTFTYKNQNAFIKHICLLTDQPVINKSITVGDLKGLDVNVAKQPEIIKATPTDRDKPLLKDLTSLWLDGPIREDEDIEYHSKLRSKN